MAEPLRVACDHCTRVLDELRESNVPAGLWGGIARYLVHGIAPGHFLTAVLSNDLVEACARVDETNRPHLFDIVNYLYNHADWRAWHSAVNVGRWLETAHEDSRSCGLVL